MEVVIISSTHFAERDDEQTGGLRLVPALENIGFSGIRVGFLLFLNSRANVGCTSEG